MDYIITGIYSSILLVCSILDIRKRMIKRHVLIITAVILMTVGILIADCSIVERMLGLIPGALFFITGFLTRGGIGLADSILISAIGIGIGISGCVSALTVALTLSGIYALVYIAFHFKQGGYRNKTMPFIPFIFIGFIISKGLAYAAW